MKLLCGIIKGQFGVALLLALLLLAPMQNLRAGDLTDDRIPALTGRVVDRAGIIDAASAQALTTRLADYEASTTNQVVVVTLPSLEGRPIEDWGLALGRDWGIGQKGKDNGVLLIVAPNEHRVRIEVGYGLEGTLPDATAGGIIARDIVPYFKSGNFSGGIVSGVDAILATLGGASPPLRTSPAGPAGIGDFIHRYSAPLFLLLVIFVGCATSLRRKWDPKRKRYGWYWFGDDPNSGPIWPATPPSSRGLGAGSGTGLFGGGGFGGGGGGFGGGGASGGW